MKYMIFLDRPARQSVVDFRQSLLAFLEALPPTFTTVRLALNDEAVAPAQALAMLPGDHPHDALASLTAAEDVDVLVLVQQLCALSLRCCAYRVEEREPLHHEAAPGRVEGMCQVAIFSKPARLTREQWLDIWLGSHTQVAIDTQSTFSYRQNIVTSVLPLVCEGACVGQVVDAIVEEQFPAEAMTNRAVFFAAPGDTARYKSNEQAMLASVMRFIDFAGFACMPMSEYRLR